jgi:hypothetical protein
MKEEKPASEVRVENQLKLVRRCLDIARDINHFLVEKTDENYFKYKIEEVIGLLCNLDDSISFSLEHIREKKAHKK